MKTDWLKLFKMFGGLTNGPQGNLKLTEGEYCKMVNLTVEHFLQNR